MKANRNLTKTLLLILLFLFSILRMVIIEISPRLIPAGILLLSSCADERPPTGGKKDTIPPKFLFSDPKNLSINFRSNKIKIRFNEFLVQTLDPKEILISPPIEKRPKFSVNGKNIIVKLNSKLKDSTTYTINFGDAVKDINENNICKNFSYVFATGSKLDSASITGSVSNFSDPKDLENIIVSLYPSDSVDGILYSKPYYFSKSDKAGHFKINNIKSGGYLVYALKDQNLNYKYDQAEELIGYLDSTVVLTDSSNLKLDLSVFLNKVTKPKFLDAFSISPGKVLFTYNSGIQNLNFNTDILGKGDKIEINGLKDSIIYWYSNIYAKKIKVWLLANDSIKDTVRLDLKYYSGDSTNNDKKYSVTFESQTLKADTNQKFTINLPLVNPFKPLGLTLTRPVDSINPIKRLVISNDSTRKTDSVNFLFTDSIKRHADIIFKADERSSYTLEVPDSTIKDLFGWWNKKWKYKFITDAFDNYGNILLSLKISHPEKYYIFKILDQDNKTIATYYYTGNSERKITLYNVRAGSYHLQAIEDSNKNGEWDSGDFYKKTQPERIINFRETYELKGKWDLEIEVTIQ